MEIKPLAENKKFEPNDLWARIIGIPLVALMVHLIIHQPNGPMAQNGGMKGYLFALIYTLAYWEGLRRVWSMLQTRYPHYSQTRNRLVFLGLSVLIYGMVITVFIEYLAAFLFEIHCGLENILQGYLKGLVPSFLVLLIYETIYFFHSWREKVIEAEAISRTQVQSQLEALKNQLDPHFLFNSLNTLSSLINENESAQNYLSRLADVYRYVLMSKDRNTVTLKEELAFVSDFLYLAKVRFQDGLEITVSIPDACLSHTVAPLSIQLLVENALKHNVITRENPLTIQLEISENYLWVKNEIKPKVHLESTTKIGLTNILERYKLLTLSPVQIINDHSRFEVGIPLI